MYNIIVGQSGGPTAVINASLSGVISKAVASEEIDNVYGMVNGIEGFLEGKYINLEEELTKEDIISLKNTPAAYLGSCRYKLPKSLEDEVYAQIFDALSKLDIKAFFYIGGNDSMDTVAKLSEYAKSINSEIRFIGVPKTIDNDLVKTDHTPGFGSTAKYVASTVREITMDVCAYKHASVTIVELMGRHAGWVTAASVLARSEYEANPVLIYLPESAFDVDTFVEDVKAAIAKHSSIVVCVSEGIADGNGRFICEYGNEAGTDKFGHKMLTGCGKVLENIIKEKIGCKCRSIELNIPQRCSAILASMTDINEAFGAGEYAVASAIAGNTGKMVSFVRAEGEYSIEYGLEEAVDICNKEKKFPMEWINENGNDIKEEFIDYVLPLIQGEAAITYENGLPRYIKPAYK